MVRVKKYHQTRKDRRHESEGMRHHDRKDSRHASHGRKSYHQTERDRRHESEGMRDRSHESHGMNQYKKGYRDGLDSHFMGMISEDRNAPSNLPQLVIHKHYPMTKYMDKYELDDSIYGVDDNMNDSVRRLDENPSGSMY